MTRRWWYGGGAVVALLLVGGLVAWRDATAARGALEDARAQLRAGQTALLDDEDPDAAAAAFTAAGEAAASAEAHTDGALWALGRWVPVVGPNVDFAKRAADLAVAASDLGEAAATEAGGLLSGDVLADVVVDGAVDLDAVQGVLDQIDALPVQPVVDATAAAEAVDPDALFGFVRKERDSALALADRVLDRYRSGRTALETVASFLGADGDRTYLLAMQNNAELRGTGGLISYMAELHVSDGRMNLGGGASVDTEVIYRGTAEDRTQFDHPVDRPSAFADRYDDMAGGAFFASVNLDPDLPTVGPVLSALYTQRLGVDLDGVVMMDPVALGTIVEASGSPLPLPDVAVQAGLPAQVSGDRLAETVMVDAYDALGGGTPEKRGFDEAVIVTAFDRLTAGGWDAVAMARAIGQTIATRHLQLWVPAEEDALMSLGAGGAMSSDGSDFLGVTAINAAANKLDVHVAHRMTGRFTLGPVRTGAPATSERQGTLTVAVDNPVTPGDHVVYVEGSTEPRHIGSPGSARVDDALARTWFSIWTPEETAAPEVREDGQKAFFRAGVIHGQRVFDHTLETPSDSTTSFDIDLDGWVDLTRDGDDLVYRLRLWRQAKAIPDHWDLQFDLPPAYRVVSATVSGGGSPSGLGAGGDDGEPITAGVDGRTVRVKGAVTQDAVVEIRMRAAEG